MAVKGKALLGAAISGILLIFSFPKFGTGNLAWVALVPLLVSLQAKKPIEGILLGFITGIISYAGLLYWIVFVIVEYGYLPVYLGITAMIFLSAYLALYTALYACGTSYCDRLRIPRTISSPLVFTSLEYVKSHLLTGFPWENLAYSQYLNNTVIQIADITGTYGITYVIVLVNTVIADILTREEGRRPWKLSAEIAAASVIFAGMYLYGYFRIGEVNRLLNNAETMNVALIQGNIDQSIKWNPRYQRETIDIYKRLSLQFSRSTQGFIVWPETAVPFYFQDINDLHREIVEVADKSRAFLLVGSPAYSTEGKDTSFYNSAFLLLPDGTISGRYDKVHLVPYGEYVPLRRYFPFLGKMAAGIGDFGVGKGFVPLPMNGHSLGILICYEAIFPVAGRTYKTLGADLLVNITNDAWFGRTSAPIQHLSMATFRAVENRLFLVRAANTGVSAIVDPTGRIVAQTGLFERTGLQGQVHFLREVTFYELHGDYFVWICMAVLSIVFLTSAIKRRKPNDRRIS